jgi:hypothetical protein
MHYHGYLYILKHRSIYDGKMGRKKKDEEKRGRKHPEGVTKNNILLLALEYPDGIEEPDLVEQIQNKLGITELKGIKGHLADLGEGRKKPGREKINTRKGGKHYLIKVAQLGKENIWTPNPDFGIFQKMALKFLGKVDLAVPFMRTEYTQRMVNEHVFDLIEKKFGMDLSNGESAEELKDLLLKYPSALRYLFSLPKITEEGEIDVIPDVPGSFKGTYLGHFISPLISAIPKRGKDSVEVLHLVLSTFTLIELDLNPKWRNMFDEEELAKLKGLNYKALTSLSSRSGVLENLKGDL